MLTFTPENGGGMRRLNPPEIVRLRYVGQCCCGIE